MSPVEDTSLADFRAQIETNLFGVIIMTEAVAQRALNDHYLGKLALITK